jgi:hypothetical protein
MTEIINLINVYFKNIWKCHNKTPYTTSENVLKKKKVFLNSSRLYLVSKYQ